MQRFGQNKTIHCHPPAPLAVDLDDLGPKIPEGGSERLTDWCSFTAISWMRPSPSHLDMPVPPSHSPRSPATPAALYRHVDIQRCTPSLDPSPPNQAYFAPNRVLMSGGEGEGGRKDGRFTACPLSSLLNGCLMMRYSSVSRTVDRSICRCRCRSWLAFSNTNHTYQTLPLLPLGPAAYPWVHSGPRPALFVSIPLPLATAAILG